MSSLRPVPLIAAVSLLVMALTGCAAPDPTPEGGDAAAAMRAREDFTTCRDPRPEICTQEYVPVCGLRRTGTESAPEPGDGAFERVTRSNRCTACADGEVVGWIPSACDADPAESPLFLDP